MSLLDLPRPSQRFALYALFFLPGVALASWVTRTPALRDALQASTEQMGMILFGFSSGAMGGILSAGWLSNRVGTRPATALGMAALVLGLALLALAVPMASAPLAFVALAAVGMGIGWVEIAVNIETAALERALKRLLMTTLHGFFSLGTLVGAALGLLMTSLQASVAQHMAAAAALLVLVALPALRQFPQGSPEPAVEHTQNTHGDGSFWHLLKDTRLLLIGFVVLAMALAEGTANDWLPLLMIDGHGFQATAGMLIYVSFTIGMTLGRFAGEPVIKRFGRVTMLRVSGVFAAGSLALIVFTSVPWLAALAVVFWGLGASLGFPLAISAAGESGPHSAQRVTLAATAGYVAFLVGPPMLGLLGEHWGLRMAMLPVMALVLASVAAAGAARRS